MTQTAEEKNAYDKSYYEANRVKKLQGNKLYRIKNHDKLMKRKRDHRKGIK